jgi:DNA primase
MEISEIKALLSMANILKYYGLKPDKNTRLICPFHDDNTPSLQIYYKTQTAYCFAGSCKTHGHSLDVIDFIMHKESLNKHEALKKASQLIGQIAPMQATAPKAEKILSKNILPRAEFYGQLFSFCESALKTSNPAKIYMHSRGLRQTTPSAQGLEIGYHSGRFHIERNIGNTMIESCLHYSIIKKNGNHPTNFNSFGKNSLAFALRNESDEIVSLYFRNIANDITNKHFYTRDRQGLYPGYPRLESKILILTESIIDASSLMLHLPNTYEILALFGTNGLTEEHQKAIKQIKELDEIILFLDGDEAGRMATELHSHTLKTLLPNTKISKVDCPEGEDINSLLQGHKAEILLHLIEKRVAFFSSIEEKKAEPIFENTPLKPVEHRPDNFNSKNPNNLIYKGIGAEYSIKGGIKGGLESLKVSLQILKNNQDYRSKLDLYEYKQVQSLCELAGVRLGIRTDEIEKDLTSLARLLEEYREQASPAESQKTKEKAQKVSPQMTSQCITFLKKENLLTALNDLIGKSGVVGEENNRLLLLVIASSYAMPDTLHALVQGSSGSGKTHLLLQIAKLMPQEDTITLTRVTESSFYNYGEYDLKNKILCMEDLDGMKEEAFLAFRELQSRGMLTSSTSIKDEQGNIKGMIKTVKGPIATLSATTKGEIYEDNMSRCFLVAVDETSTQTQRIIKYQNQVSAGQIDKQEQKRIMNFVQNCIRLLSPYEVVNPYANLIQLPPEAHKIRRLNELYQAFVRQITLLNQFQRPKDDKGRLIASKEDLQSACQILFDSIVLKVDELDGSLRLFYEKLKDYVSPKSREYEFTRREVRQVLGMSKTQQHNYMLRLEEMEYIRQSGGHINRGLHYKIVHWDSYTAIRAKIKTHLESQLQQIGKENN